MPESGHIADRLGAWLAGTLPETEAGEVRSHLAACAACAEEGDLLRQGMSVVPPVPAVEPRPGFAGRIAARAGELRPRPLGAPWWRWALGGGLAVAAAAVLIAHPVRPAERARVEENYRRFGEMPPEQRQQVVQQWQRFRSLSPQEREQLRESLRRVMNAAPAERRQILDNMERWQRMTPEQREDARQRFREQRQERKQDRREQRRERQQERREQRQERNGRLRRN